jgi:hypothetical protein
MSCIDIYVEKLARLGKQLSIKDRAAAETRFRDREAQLAFDGHGFLDVNPATNRTYGEEIVDREFLRFVADTAENAAETISTAGIMMKRAKELDSMIQSMRKIYPKMKELELEANAYMSQLVDTNFTFNTLSLEGLNLAEAQALHGNFAARVGIAHPDFELDVMLGNAEFRNQFIDELFNMTHVDRWETARSTPLSTTKMLEAHSIAKIFVEEAIEIPNAKMQAMGRQDRRPFLNRLAVQFTEGMMKDKFKTRDEFVDFMLTNKLPAGMRKADYVHEVKSLVNQAVYKDAGIDPAQLMGDIFEEMASGTGIRSYRDIPAYVDNYLGNGRRDPRINGIEYTDGAAFRAVNDLAGYETEISQLMLNTMRNNARITSLTKFFGPAYVQAFNDLRAEINFKFGGPRLEKLRETTPFGSTAAQFNAVLNTIESKINPDIQERSGIVPIFTIARRVQSFAKLGSAVITSMIDVPVFLFTGRRMFGNNWNELLRAVFNVVPGINTSDKKFTNYILEFSESWLDSAKDRLGFIDNIYNASRAGSLTRGLNNGSAAYSNFIFKYSGLNYWTRNLQSGAAGMYAKEFGQLIGSGTQWNKMNPRFQAQLQKYGLNENDWNRLLATQPLDQRGRLDLYQVRENFKTEIIVGGDNIQNKLIAAIADAVNTMVIKPGEFDKLSTALYQAPEGVIGQIMKLITQFKTHPITYTRKVLVRQFTRDTLKAAGHDPKLHHKAADAAYLLGGMTLVSLVALQAKQIVAGKAMYDINNPAVWVDVARQAGYGGYVQDLAMDFFLRDVLMQAVSNDPEAISSSSEKYDRLLGPIISDAMKILQNTVRTATGSVRYAKDIDDGEYMEKGLSGLTQMFGQYTGLKNFILTKMLYRKYLSEYLSEALNPQEYRRAERRAQNEADEMRRGKLNNWIFEQLP